MSTTINLLDLIFISFAVIFVALAFFRGFVKEIFSLFNWIIALIVSYFFSPYIADILSSYSKNRIAIDVASHFVIFLITFIATIFSTSEACKIIQKKFPKYIDRSLGVLFGLVKTMLIFGFIYSLANNGYSLLVGKNSEKQELANENLPSWLKDAKCYNLLRVSGDIIDPIVKGFLSSINKSFDNTIPKESKNLDEKINQLIDDEKTNFQPNNEKEVESGIGYNKKDIEKMNRLIEIIDK
jgi:membrane protein required for colicin V production